MKLKNTSVYLLAGWMLAACSGGGFQKTENGVVVEVKQQQPTDVRKVRLEVMGEKLIHVSATPEKEFSKEQSLIVIPQQNKTDFKVEEQGDEVTVKTSELCAIVSTHLIVNEAWNDLQHFLQLAIFSFLSLFLNF